MYIQDFKKGDAEKLKTTECLTFTMVAVELIKTLPMNVFIVLLKYLRTNS
ncbi:hypothetical protein HMP0721_0952 [Pseudoramibacter alactolyticus ATCC 23263]|uniref:Uncharacterized protein n=1 Tax=Pseudoramibacter alactolyticus ATCC 23263 TaxID=887929 RepID=E6MG19_9FIRM|nr:hypothetical protein HMP0721_0952 [Pseudoramibacter alactolyticus ATCC 23263]